MTRSAVYQEVGWNGTAFKLDYASSLSLKATDNCEVCVQVNMQGNEYPHDKKDFIDDIFESVGSEIQDLLIYNYRLTPKSDDGPIDISDVGLKYFSLSTDTTIKSACVNPPVLINQPSETLTHFAMQCTPIDQKLVNTISSCPNLLGVMMTSPNKILEARKSSEPITIPPPTNRKIKYWMFKLGKTRIKDWKSRSLEVFMLSGAEITRLPAVLNPPPKTIQEVYLPNNRLTDKEIVPMKSMMDSEDIKILSLSGNHTLIDIPIIPRIRGDIFYFADALQFNSESPSYPLSIPPELKHLGYQLGSPLLGDDIMQVPWECAPITRAHHYKTVYINDVQFLTDNYSTLMGYSEYPKTASKNCVYMLG